MSERWSNKLMESWKPCFACRDGQQLNLILPQLKNDVRRQIAETWTLLTKQDVRW